jgi:hypothetical protein
VLARLNTHGVGDGALLGGGIGLSAILATLAHFFAVISDGGFVLMLYGEHRNHEFGPAHAQLVGLAIGIVGAVILTGISGVAAYFSRPRSIS